MYRYMSLKRWPQQTANTFNNETFFTEIISREEIIILMLKDSCVKLLLNIKINANRWFDKLATIGP